MKKECGPELSDYKSDLRILDSVRHKIRILLETNNWISTIMICYLVVLTLVAALGSSQETSSSPARLPPAATGKSNNNGTCTPDAIGDQLEQTRGFLQNLIPSCACGESGEWTRVAYVNMEDLSQQCPSSWNLFTSGAVRGCVSSVPPGSCDSAIFPTNGRNYSHVCGRVTAYQRGFTSAFSSGAYDGEDLDGPYVDGVSLTHGGEGSRQHIWSFAAAQSEYAYYRHICFCTDTREARFNTIDYVGSNYFCDTGNDGLTSVNDPTELYSDDPLWDGEGCGPYNTCCERNNVPWFCTTIPPTTDDLELRICRNTINNGAKDIIVSLINISVM